MQRRIVIAMEHRKGHLLPKAPQTVRLKQSVLENERLREIASVAAADAAFYPACNDRFSLVPKAVRWQMVDRINPYARCKKGTFLAIHECAIRMAGTNKRMAYQYI